MNAAVGLMAGLGLDGDRCIRVIPRHDTPTVTKLNRGRITTVTRFPDCVLITVLINSHLITHSQIDLVDLNQ